MASSRLQQPSMGVWCRRIVRLQLRSSAESATRFYQFAFKCAACRRANCSVPRCHLPDCNIHVGFGGSLIALRVVGAASKTSSPTQVSGLKTYRNIIAIYQYISVNPYHKPSCRTGLYNMFMCVRKRNIIAMQHTQIAELRARINGARAVNTYIE